jgi:hypothetical protein
MASGHESGSGRLALTQLWNTATNFEPKSMHEQSLQQSILTEMNQLSDARHFRLCVAAPEDHPVIWLVLILGGAITVIFLYFFGVQKLGFHLIMTALITLVLGLNLIMIAMFGYPFSGDIHVSPYAFSAAKELFQQEMQGNTSMPSRSLYPGGG